MYAFVDRHPSALGNAGRFMLWAMRGWTQAVSKQACPPMSLYRGFAGAGAVGAITDFHVAMVLLHRDAKQPPRLAPMGCCRIQEDEAVLLSLWHAVARQDHTVVGGVLGHLVKLEAAKPVARAMAACATHMVLAGFDLSVTLAAKIED